MYLLDPHDGVVKLGVYGLQVLEGGLLVEHALVEGQCEACINELPVIQGLGRHKGNIQKGDSRLDWMMLLC